MKYCAVVKAFQFEKDSRESKRIEEKKITVAFIQSHELLMILYWLPYLCAYLNINISSVLVYIIHAYLLVI